jgi:hypothetical protein
MRLVEAPLVSTETVEIPPHTISEKQNEAVFFIGKRTFHNVFIQLEGEEVVFGQKVEKITIDPWILYGVIPFRWESRKQKIIECVADWFEIK